MGWHQSRGVEHFLEWTIDLEKSTIKENGVIGDKIKSTDRLHTNQ